MENIPAMPGPTACLRLALPLMSKHNIPITPANYAVWYSYVSGENAELQKQIDAIIISGTGFSTETNCELAGRFGLGTDADEVQKIRAQLILALKTIGQEISELSGKTGQYGSTLAKSTDLLTGELSNEDLKILIDHIITETKAIAEYGKATHKRMEAVSAELKAMRENVEQLRVQASIDFLTGLPNRKTFDEVLSQSILMAKSQHQELSLLLIDIDHFKRVNDEHGHVVGDEVLKYVAQQIKKQVRGNDFVSRFGGEEFAVILPNTNLVGAKAVAENIRTFFSNTNLKTSATSRSLGRITLSIGAANYRPSDDSDQFIQRADHAMYHAKNTGRDRVCIQSPSDRG